MKLRETMMNTLAEFVIRYYKLILPIGLIVAAAAFFAAGNIKVRTQLKDMMDPNNPRVTAYDEINEVFGSVLILTVEGKDKSRMARAAEELAAKVRDTEEISRYVRSVNLKLDRDFLSRWGLMLQKPEDLRRTRALFSRTNLLPFVKALNDNLEQAYTGDEAEKDLETGKQENDAVASMSQLESFTEGLTDFVTRPDPTPADDAARSLADTIVFGDLYVYSPDGTMLLCAVNTNIDLAKSMEAADGIMVGIKKAIAAMKADYSDLEFGYTGDIGMQADENTAMANDLVLPSLLAYGAILILFLFSFNQIRAIVLAMLSLVIGILFDYAIVGITIGEINLLTSTGTALLIGMGIDYGIQVVTSFSAFREEGHSPQDAVRLTFRKSGVGIMLAAASTSASFFVLMNSSSKGIFQFGIVAGMGILTCFLVMILILPSLLLLLGKRGVVKARIPQINFGLMEKVGSFAGRHRVPVLVLSVLVTAGLLIAAFGLKGQFNMLELEPQKAPSIIMHRRILDKFGINAMSASVMARSLEEAKTMTEALEKIPQVAEVQSITSLLPAAEDQETRLSEIALFRESPPRVSTAVFTAADMDELSREIQRLEWNMIELGDLSVAGLGENNKIVKKRNEMVREVFGAEVGKPGKEVFKKLIEALKAGPAAARLSALDAPFARTLSDTVRRMSAANRPMTVGDLPGSLADNYFDKTRAFNLITIYPKAGAVDEEAGLRRLDAVLRTVSPSITGLIPLSLDFFDELFRESRKSAFFVGGLVLLFSFLGFRNIRDTAVASIPAISSLVLLFGTLALFKFKINAMNLIALPLNIGIGIAYGTYMMQRFILEGRNLANTLKYTTKAIFLSAFTTMVGFGSLGLAGSYQMISSFGTVLFIGITFCFLTTLVILPALLGGKKQPDLASAKGAAQ